MCTAPGTAPPRLARTVVPQYSPSVRVSRITASGVPIAALTSRQVAMRPLLARAGPRRSAAAAPASRVTGRPAARPGAEAAVEQPHARVAEVLEEPERARGAHARLLVVDDDRRRRVDAVDREHVLDHPHERLERRRIGVDQADAPQIEVDGAGDVPAA